MDESSIELLSTQSHNNHNNNNNNDQKSENVSDKNANPIDLNAQINNSQNELLDIDSSDFDFDSLDGDQNEIENMLLQAMDSNASENDTNTDAAAIAFDSHNHTIDTNDFKHSTTDNNNIIPTTSNNEMCHSNDNANAKQIEQHQTNVIEPKPADNCNVQDNESNVSIIDVNNDEHYDSAEEGEPIFDFLGKANEIVCCIISIYFNTKVYTFY